jgi:hypothetical protein
MSKSDHKLSRYGRKGVRDSPVLGQYPEVLGYQFEIRGKFQLSRSISGQKDLETLQKPFFRRKFSKIKINVEFSKRIVKIRTV